MHLPFSSHREELSLLPVPSLSRSRSRLFDDANPTNETLSAEIAALVRRFLEGSQTANRACKAAADDAGDSCAALVIREVTTLDRSASEKFTHGKTIN